MSGVVVDHLVDRRQQAVRVHASVGARRRGRHLRCQSGHPLLVARRDLVDPVLVHVGGAEGGGEGGQRGGEVGHHLGVADAVVMQVLFGGAHAEELGVEDGGGAVGQLVVEAATNGDDEVGLL
jgi:hypothetical protein